MGEIRVSRRVTALVAFALGALVARPAQAAEKASEQVSAFHGTFGYAVPIEVPSFRGLEPRIGLAYNSEGRNGFAGVGWTLGGFSTIERANAGRGTPRFDAGDIYLLDGQEMLACAPTTVSPSCTTGGTHATKIESYQRIGFDSAANSWTVTAKDGTRTVFNPVVTTPFGTLRWGVSQRIDTLGNQVTYSWACVNGDCYPSASSYNGYGVTFHRETRPDIQSHGEVSTVAQTLYRLRTILVHLGSAPIRAYKLDYTVSPVTGRSLLASVTQYGKDVVLDSSGAVTGGSALPPVTFSYQNDTIAKGFHPQEPNPPTPPGTTEPVAWTRLQYVWAPGNSNSIQKYANPAWDAGASSTKAIASGNGFVEWTAMWDGYKMTGLSNGDSDWGYVDIDFALFEISGGLVYVYESGYYMTNFPVADGDRLRVEVENGQIKYKRNGVTYYTSTRTPVYPLLVDTSIYSPYAIIRNVDISGALQDVAHWCSYLLLTADFNGDGWTDQLCYNSSETRVSMGSPTGFGVPTTWFTGPLSGTLTADVNGDGKADLIGGPDWYGYFSVALSTGTSFSAPTFWGEATGWAPDGFPYSCRIDPAVISTGDFNGDGKADVACRLHGHGEVFVGISTGSSFSFSIWAQIASENAAQEGALDFDGDGKDDWYVIGWGRLYINRNTGGGFTYGYFGAASIVICDNSYVLGDFNADGKTDAFCPVNGNIAWSTGYTFTTQTGSGAWCSTGSSIFAVDVDGDAASELVCKDPSGTVQVRKWNGTAFGPAETWASNWCGSSVLAGDFNSDGKTDLFCRNKPFPVAFAGTSNVKADLVTNVTTPLGGSVQPAYALSIAPPNDNGPPAKYVISALTVNDGRGGVSTTTYTYSGGTMDYKERRYLGFQHVTQTHPCIAGETGCPTTDTWLRQDLPSAGQVERVERRDGADRLLVASQNEFTVNANTPPLTSLVTGQWSYTYDGTGATCSTWPCSAGRRTYSARSYDSYGNLGQIVSYGDYDASGDEVTTMWIYQPNTAAYLAAHPAAEQRFAGVGVGGAKLTESLLHYDGAASWSQPPTQGLPTTVLEWLNTENRHVARSVTYDGWGNRVSTTDATSRTTSMSYDPTYHAFPISFQNPAGETESLAWDPLCGAPTQATDANGQVSTTQYDPLCRPIRTDGPLGAFTVRSYLEFGNPATQRVVVERPPPTGSAGNHYAIQYQDGFGRTYRRVSRGPAPGQDVVSDVIYDARGNVASTTAPYYQGQSPQVATYDYDALDRRVETRFPDGSTRTKSYGLWTETTEDEHGHPVTARHDAFGRRIRSEAQLAGQTVGTDYGYDLLGRLTATSDHLGHAWSWTFDSLGRTIARNDPDSGFWTFEFDDAGRQKARTDAKNQRIEWTYDAGGRLATKTTPEGAVTYAYSEPRPGYVNVGRLTTVQSPADVLKTDHDAQGRVVRRERVFEGTSYVEERRYGAGGRLLGITYPDGDAIGTPQDPIRYDGAGRVLSVPGVITQVLYDPPGRPVQKANANGTVTTWTYSPQRGFLTGITTIGSTTIQNLAYSPDSAGLLIQVGGPFANETWSYDYDDFHRLLAADNASSPAESQSFQYDEIGRIVYNSRVGPYSYPPTGAPQPHAPAVLPGGSYSYDLNGNLITGGGRTFVWNSENLPTQINGVQFVYDGQGERLKKASSSSVSLYPLGDDFEVTNGDVTKYLSLPGLGVVAKRVGNTTYWLHTDRLGSVQAVTDLTGTEVQRRTYRPYGSRIGDTTSHAESRGWIDQREDDDAHLVYLHARYYDPETGVFVSPDLSHPLEPGVGTNRYGYGAGDPINRADRNGEYWVPVCLKWKEEYTCKSRAGAEECDVIAICVMYGAYWVDDPEPDRPPGAPPRPGKGGPGPGKAGPGTGKPPNQTPVPNPPTPEDEDDDTTDDGSDDESSDDSKFDENGNCTQSGWFCYESCVNKYVLDPLGYGGATLGTAIVDTAWNSLDLVPSASSLRGLVTAGEYWSMQAAGQVAGELGASDNGVRAGMRGLRAGTIAGRGLSVAKGALAVWGAGSVLGCGTTCSINACAY